MKSSPTISVIVPAYNSGPYIIKAINSALHQGAEDMEIIIVDDGSTDDTEATVRSINDPRVHYYYQPNSGRAGSPRNRALELATGDFIAFLDSDDYWLPNHLSTSLELLANNLDHGLVFSDMNLLNNKTGKLTPWFDKPVNSEHLRSSNDFTENEQAIIYHNDFFERLMNQNIIPLPTVVIRRKTLLKVGLFDETTSLEDRDFWIRLAEMGCLFIANKNIGMHCRVQPESSSRRPLYYKDHLKYWSQKLKIQKYQTFSAQIRSSISQNQLQLAWLMRAKFQYIQAGKASLFSIWYTNSLNILPQVLFLLKLPVKALYDLIFYRKSQTTKE